MTVPANPKEALERLEACAEHLACNAANLRDDTLSTDPQADFYHRMADQQGQWANDLRTALAYVAQLEAELAELKGRVSDNARTEHYGLGHQWDEQP